VINRLRNYLLDLRDRQRIAIALARGSATMHRRAIDMTRPSTWEFSGFSQNGEDGILDTLRARLRSGNRYFLEIGAADGIENNTAWLAIAEKYDGIMIEGNAKHSGRARRMIPGINIGVECINLFVTPGVARRVADSALYNNPDVFSLDIDGNDYYVAQALFEAGLKPKILVVEYNSAFGPERSATIKYHERFDLSLAHPTQLYYGASIAAWRTCLSKWGYRFVTVERNGVNAFFVDPACFEEEFLDRIKGLTFAENHYQFMKFRVASEGQFALISSMPFVTV